MSKRKKSPPSGRAVPTGEMAKLLGISVSRLEEYVRSGCPCDRPEKGGRGQAKKFDPEEVRAWMNQHGRPGTPGRPTALDRLAMRERADGGEAATGPAGAGAKPGHDEPPAATDSADELVRKRALSEAKKAHFDAIKAQVQALREQGKVIDAADAAAAWGEESARVRQALLALPARAAPRLVGLAEAPLTIELERAVREVLTTLAAADPATKAADEG